MIAPDRRLSIFSLTDATSDQHGWTHKAVLSSFGVSVGVLTDDPALLSALCQHLPPGARTQPISAVDLQYSMYSRPTASDRGRVQPMYVGHSSAGLFVDTFDRATACEAFESKVQSDIAMTSTGWVFVRAGVVVHDGEAIVIPAPATLGKSTLVEALVRAGATYYSDEYAAIDLKGRVHAFPMPLSLRSGDGRKRRVPIDDAKAPLPPVPIRTIVSTRHEPGASWRPRRGTPAESVMTLLSNTITSRQAQPVTLDVLARATEGATLLEGPRGDADLIAPQLLRENR